MKLTKRTINILIGAAVAIILIAIVVRVVRNRKTDSSGNTDTGSGAPSSAPTSSGLKNLGNDTILKRGSKGQQVQWVQYYYNKKYAIPMGKTKLVTDGIYGPKTEAAVKLSIGSTQTSWNSYKAIMDGGVTASSNNSNTYEWQFGGQYDYQDNQFPWETQS